MPLIRLLCILFCSTLTLDASARVTTAIHDELERELMQDTSYYALVKASREAQFDIDTKVRKEAYLRVWEYGRDHSHPYYRAIAHYWKSLEAYDRGDPAESKEKQLFAMAAFQELGDSTSMLSSYSSLIRAHSALENMVEGLEVAKEALQLATVLDDSVMIAGYHLQMASYGYNTSRYQDCLQHALLAVQYYEAHRDTGRLLYCYKIMGMANWGHKRHEVARSWFQKTIDLAGDKRLSESVFSAYLSAARVSDQMDDSVTAFNYLREAGAYREKLPNLRARKEYDYQIASSKIHERFRNYDEALEHALMAIVALEEINHDRLRPSAWYQYLHLHKKIEDEGLTVKPKSVKSLETHGYTLKGLWQELNECAPDIQLVNIRRKVTRLLAAEAADQGDFEEAYRLHLIVAELMDQMHVQDRADVFAEASTQFETEKKEQTIALQQAEILANRQSSALQREQSWRTQLMLWGGLSLAVIISLVVFIAYRKARRDKAVIARQNGEKEVLLKEIHHRVKNNLQVISGLLQLQANRTSNEEVKELMADGQGRIKSMAMVHQMLYQNTEFTSVPFRVYLEELTSQIVAGYQRSQAIELRIKATDKVLDVDAAIPLGLIANELLTNAYKHAFMDGTGKIDLELNQLEGSRFEFVVRDNGVGISTDVDPEKTRTTGLRLVNVLCEQLQAELQVLRDSGTTFKIAFDHQLRA